MTLNCFSAHVTLEPDTYSCWQAYSAIRAHKDVPPDCNLSTLTVNKNSTLVHAGIMMDTGDTAEREQSHFDSQPSKCSSTGSRFPYK